MKYSFILILFSISLISCKPGTMYIESYKDLKELKDINNEANDTLFVNLKNYSRDFIFDMKYATDDNFLKKQVYPCDKCILKVKTVRALLMANEAFKKKGFQIKIFDCYRPLDIQKKMWKIMPNPDYVANPMNGSIHNRGCAVDITLVDSLGVELKMGTEFDFFGEEASHRYENLPADVLANRKMLKEIMMENGFVPMMSEWWHYNLKNGTKDKVSNFKWECED
jgi:zinc D-Ala-D-Ala dipeptidase